jgi:serine/threonine protein kinase
LPHDTGLSSQATPEGCSLHLSLAPGARPIADFELIERLGRGGFGEVWKANAPGGFAVALKFIRLADPAATVEIRSLEVMKDIRHAHLLGLFGAWYRDGVLIVAMELADRSLLDRLEECRRQGHPGIPAAELLQQVHDAARGLDHLNGLGIQHRDVKPQNLLLVGGSVKLADFGLAKLLEHTGTSNTGSMTPSYAAPEFLHGATSDRSDQYALAVSYCLLRGGRLPFAGNQAQIMAGHMMRPPDLTMLPERERPAVGRALAKKPEERWHSCRAFVTALAAAATGKAAAVPGPLPVRSPIAASSSDCTTPTRTKPPPLPVPTPTRIEPGTGLAAGLRWPLVAILILLLLPAIGVLVLALVWLGSGKLTQESPVAQHELLESNRRILPSQPTGRAQPPVPSARSSEPIKKPEPRSTPAPATQAEASAKDSLRARSDLPRPIRPRVLVEWAVRVLGGEARLARHRAWFRKVKGTIQADGRAVKFTGEFMADGRDRRNVRMEFDVPGEKRVVVTVLNGQKGWMRVMGETTELQGDQLAEELEFVHHSWVCELVPLLREDGFELTPLGQTTIEGKEAVGVKVSFPGRRDVDLYLDRRTGLLLKSRSLLKSPDGQEVGQEHFYGQYKEFDGVQIATRVRVKQGGRQFMTFEVLDYRPLERLAGGEFVRP